MKIGHHREVAGAGLQSAARWSAGEIQRRRREPSRILPAPIEAEIDQTRGWARYPNELATTSAAGVAADASWHHIRGRMLTGYGGLSSDRAEREEWPDAIRSEGTLHVVARDGWRASNPAESQSWGLLLKRMPTFEFRLSSARGVRFRVGSWVDVVR